MTNDAAAGFGRLLETIQRLRAPDGCAWDRAQTPVTLRGSLVEEVWECVSAIDAEDEKNLAEELGDLYLLVTMIAWMKEQEGTFTVSAALAGIRDKLIRRHPHVFGAAKTDSVDTIKKRWDEIKTEERGGPAAQKSALDHIARSLPPLEKAHALQKKAAKAGFDWPDQEPVWDKVAEEMAELRGAAAGGSRREIEEELGDLLFSIVNLSRFLDADPAISLNATNTKFERRFREVERRLAAQGIRAEDAGLARMDELWNQIKAEEDAAASGGAGGGAGASAGAGGSQNASK